MVGNFGHADVSGAVAWCDPVIAVRMRVSS